MVWPFSKPITADTTKFTADNTISRPIRRMAERLKTLLPPGWFKSTDAPIRDAILAGAAVAFTVSGSFVTYAKRQTRLKTISGLWLDLAAYDLFGLRFQRRRGETDESFNPRLRAELLRPRATKQALIDKLTDLTGISPRVLEPFNPGDCGAYGVGTFAYGGNIGDPPVLSGYGETSLGAYGVGAISYGQPLGGGRFGGGAGAYGSVLLPNQFFVTVHRGPGVFRDLGVIGGYGVGPIAYGGGQRGVPSLSGYGSPLSGYGVGSASYGSPPGPFGYTPGAGYYLSKPDLVIVTDEEIYAAIAETTATGAIAWTRIKGT